MLLVPEEEVWKSRKKGCGSCPVRGEKGWKGYEVWVVHTTGEVSDKIIVYWAVTGNSNDIGAGEDGFPKKVQQPWLSALLLNGQHPCKHNPVY